MEKKPDDTEVHHVVFTHPFDNAGRLLRGGSGGGMGTVFRREVAKRRLDLKNKEPMSKLSVLSLDAAEEEVPDAAASVRPFLAADGAQLPRDPEHYQREAFDDYLWWMVLHPDSVTAPRQDPESLRQMFRLQCEGVVGTLDFACRYLDTHGAAAKVPGAKAMLDGIFGPAIAQVPDRSIVHWSMQTMLPVMHVRADALRARQVYQTYHHHFPVPDSLILHAEGRRALEAMSKMDAVYFHTDLDRRNFLTQCEALRLPIPRTVALFALGIDEVNLHNATRITADNYQTSIADFSRLSQDRQELFHMAARCKARHQFVIGDRIDPHKGLVTLLHGVRAFLEGQGMPIERLREEYHFLCFHEMRGRDSYDVDRIRHQYIRYADEVYAQLERDFPGVFTVSKEIDASAVPFVMRDRTFLNASSQDGLNLMTMEAVAVNALHASTEGGNTVMVGKGAGFAHQAIAQGFADDAFWVEPGDPQGIAATIGNIVELRQRDPSVLRRRMKALYHGFIERRNDTVLPQPVLLQG